MFRSDAVGGQSGEGCVKVISKASWDKGKVGPRHPGTKPIKQSRSTLVLILEPRSTLLRKVVLLLVTMPAFHGQLNM